MKLLYKHEPLGPVASFHFNRVKMPVLDTNWHFHEEYELIYIIKGNGIRLVGDNLSGFRSGELVLVGPNLPHLWRTGSDVLNVDRIIVKFPENPGNVSLFNLPECSLIRHLLKNSERGISFGRETERQARPYILDVSLKQGASKVACLLNILEILASSSEYELLSKTAVKPVIQDGGEQRLARIISFITENFDKPITLEDAAGIASMTPQSFCRFFRKRTNKTFVQFLNEYRLGKSGIALIEKSSTIASIAYDSGFCSITSYNRMFKKLYNCTPAGYRNKYSRV